MESPNEKNKMCRPCEKSTLEYLYEKAIEGRNFHYNLYNYWMNMYAIINGALFVGLCQNISCKLKFLVVILGLVAGYCWFFSVCGFYRWVISWIKIVIHYEEKLTKQMHYPGVYQCFTPKNKPYPFSTQKITKFFTGAVAMMWSLIFLCKLLKIFLNEQFMYYVSLLSITDKALILIAIVIVGMIFLLYSANHLLREDLTETHVDIR